MTNTATRPLTALALTAGIVLLSAGCAEKLAERGAEEFIERQIESEGGGKVDLDLGGDGGFSIQTEDGEVRIDTDGDGSFTVNGSGDDGEFSASGDGEGNVVIEGPDGSAVVNSEDGNTTFESDEGTVEISTGTDLPEGFPSDIALPSSLTIVTSQKMNDGDQDFFTISATSTQAPAELAAELQASLEAAGYVEEAMTTAPDTVIAHYVRGDSESVDLFAGSNGDGQSAMTLSVIYDR